MSRESGRRELFFDGPLVDGLSSIVAAAHELKSPLVLMRQLALILQDEDLSDSDKKRIIHQISLTSERALRLTSDLTRSVKLSDAMFELEPINPRQLCEDIVFELTPLFVAHGRKIKISGQKHFILLANRDLLRRIIMNFSDNALNYADKNSAVEIGVRSLDAGKTIRLSVRDYGPSLPSNIRKIMKEKLTKMPINNRPRSSGLGLYISNQFADVMNGKIGVINHRDGATFFIDLQSSQQLNLL